MLLRNTGSAGATARRCSGEQQRDRRVGDREQWKHSLHQVRSSHYGTRDALRAASTPAGMLYHDGHRDTMIDLYNDTTGELLGPITEADLKVLVDALEE